MNRFLVLQKVRNQYFCQYLSTNQTKQLNLHLENFSSRFIIETQLVAAAQEIKFSSASIKCSRKTFLCINTYTTNIVWMTICRDKVKEDIFPFWCTYLI